MSWKRNAVLALGATVALHTTCEYTTGIGCHDAIRIISESGQAPNTRINQVLDTGTSDAYEPEAPQREPDIIEIDNPTTVNTPTPDPQPNTIVTTPTAEPSAPAIRVIERQPVHFGTPEPSNADPVINTEDPEASSQIMPPAPPNRTVIRVSQDDLENCGEEPGRLRTQQRQAYQDCLNRNREVIDEAHRRNSDERVLPPSTL